VSNIECTEFVKIYIFEFFFMHLHAFAQKISAESVYI